jgi:hypothetical protein
MGGMREGSGAWQGCGAEARSVTRRACLPVCQTDNRGSSCGGGDRRQTRTWRSRQRSPGGQQVEDKVVAPPLEGFVGVAGSHAQQHLRVGAAAGRAG